MIIDSLPYLIGLIKKNIILQTIVVSSSFQNVDLTSVSHLIHTDRGIEFFNFPLDSTEIFDGVLVYITEDSSNKQSKYITIFLSTHNPKYYENTPYYFGPGALKRADSKMNKLIADMRKEIGVFKIFDSPIPPAFVSMTANPAYGYGIIVTFDWNYEEIIKNKQALEKAFESDSIIFEEIHISS